MVDLRTVDALLTEIAPLAAKDRADAAETVPQFQALSFFCSGEVISTKILAYFLNPQAPHEQGCLFLESFLEALGIDLGEHGVVDVAVLPNALCYTNYANTSRRSMDLLITLRAGETEYAIVVESKSHYAEDQENQVEDYLEYICREFPKRRKLLFYLKDGSQPSERSIRAESWEKAQASGICCAHDFRKTICKWLTSSINRCKAKKVGFFLEDFTVFLGIEDKGAKSMKNSWKRIEEILEERATGVELAHSDSGKFDALLAIYELQNQIWQKVLGLFAKRVVGILGSRLPQWKCDIEEGGGGIEVGLFPNGIDPKRRSVGVYMANELDDPQNSKTQSFCLYVKKDPSNDVWPRTLFNGGDLLLLGPRQRDFWQWTRPVGVADLKSAAGIRSLLTEQAAQEIAATFAGFAVDQWERLQEIGVS